MPSVGAGVWIVGFVYDVWGGAVFLMVDEKNDEAVVYDACDYRVCFGDGGRSV